jgi:hypothetical protein
MGRLVPTTTYEAPGNLDTASVWDTGPKALNDWLANRPAFKTSVGTPSSVASGVWTAVPFSTTDLDTDGGHNTVTNNSRYVVQVPGVYWAKGCVGWNSTGIGNNQSRFNTAIAVNGVILRGAAQFAWKQTNDNAATLASGVAVLSTGDYVEVWGLQTTGTSIYFDNGSTGTACDLSLFWVHL